MRIFPDILQLRELLLQQFLPFGDNGESRRGRPCGPCREAPGPSIRDFARQRDRLDNRSSKYGGLITQPPGINQAPPLNMNFQSLPPAS